MKIATALWLPFLVAAEASVHASDLSEMRFTGPLAMDALCTCLLDAQRKAEAQGRLDFSAQVESRGEGESLEATARVRMGTPHAVGRINFDGHSNINDTTLRRVMTLYEREPLDVQQLRRSLIRINDLGLFEPVTLADISVMRRDDGVTADLTIRLRERKRRWWSVSGPMLPGVGPLQASLASRLPSWGRGIFEAATYFVSLNVAGFAKPFLALERPVLAGQEWLSGFAISPALSPRGMLTHYGRTHLAHAIGAKLEVNALPTFAVPVTSGGRLEDEPLLCTPPTPRFWWLRRGAAAAVNVALAALIP